MNQTLMEEAAKRLGSCVQIIAQDARLMREPSPDGPGSGTAMKESANGNLILRGRLEGVLWKKVEGFCLYIRLAHYYPSAAERRNDPPKMFYPRGFGNEIWLVSAGDILRFEDYADPFGAKAAPRQPGGRGGKREKRQVQPVR